VLGEVALARQPRFRTAKGFFMTTGQFEQSFNSIGNGFAMNIAHGPRPHVTSKTTLNAVAVIRFVFATRRPPPDRIANGP
jgi:hypothetical protein